MNISDYERETRRIKIVGCGGFGINVVHSLISEGAECSEFISIDGGEYGSNDLPAGKRIHISRERLARLDQKVDSHHQECQMTASHDLLAATLQNTDFLILIAGLGGATGSGVTVWLTERAKQMGIQCACFVIAPFTTEGWRRNRIASAVIERLRTSTNDITVLSNQHNMEALYESSMLEVLVTGTHTVRDSILKLL